MVMLLINKTTRVATDSFQSSTAPTPLDWEVADFFCLMWCVGGGRQLVVQSSTVAIGAEGVLYDGNVVGSSSQHVLAPKTGMGAAPAKGEASRPGEGKPSWVFYCGEEGGVLWTCIRRH